MITYTKKFLKKFKAPFYIIQDYDSMIQNVIRRHKYLTDEITFVLINIFKCFLFVYNL